MEEEKSKRGPPDTEAYELWSLAVALLPAHNYKLREAMEAAVQQRELLLNACAGGMRCGSAGLVLYQEHGQWTVPPRSDLGQEPEEDLP